MTTDFTTGDDAAPGSVRDIEPVELKLAGTLYTFRCPKLAVWGEFAVPAASRTTVQGRTQAMVGAMVVFLHAALDPEESEELHQRKYDPDDPLDTPDLVRAFTDLVNRWRDPVTALAESAGMRLQLDAAEPPPRPGRKALPAKKTASKALPAGRRR